MCAAQWYSEQVFQVIDLILLWNAAWLECCIDHSEAGTGTIYRLFIKTLFIYWIHVIEPFGSIKAILSYTLYHYCLWLIINHYVVVCLSMHVKERLLSPLVSFCSLVCLVVQSIEFKSCLLFWLWRCSIVSIIISLTVHFISQYCVHQAFKA